MPDLPAALRGPRMPGIAITVAIFVASAILFAQYGIHDGLSRDEAIYAYGGQELAHGVPVYVSIFDPKTPLASFVAGIGALVARAVGAYQLDGIRIAFLIFASLTVVAMYLLATRLWSSRLAGLVAAAAFASFRGFAMDALAGPDAKTPGIFFLVLGTWFALDRRWLLAGAAGALATLTWQPLILYPIVTALVAMLTSERGRRWRAVARVGIGVAVPAVITVVWLALAGALGDFWQAGVDFPLTGIKRGPSTMADNIKQFWTVLGTDYGQWNRLTWVVGALALVAFVVIRVARAPRAALRDPLLCLVLLGFVLMALYSSRDFQGYPDVYPLLPYPPLGLAGIAAAAVRHAPAPRLVTAAGLAIVLASVAVSWWHFTRDHTGQGRLRAEQTEACALNRLLGPNGTFVALGDPTQLVLTGRRDPDRFIYLDSGVADWHAARLGGIDAWVTQIRSLHPDVIAVKSWYGRMRPVMESKLHAHYDTADVGSVRIYFPPAVRQRAAAVGVRLTPTQTPLATDLSGRPLRTGCAA